MDKKQLYVLSFGFLLIGMFFIFIDSDFNLCWLSFDSNVSEGQLDIGDVYCVINSEMYDPFIWIFHFLWILFIILAWLEPKKK